MFKDGSSAGAVEQRESDRPVVDLGNPVAAESWLAPYSNTGGSNPSWREVRKAGQYAFRCGIDWHEGWMYGEMKDAIYWASALQVLQAECVDRGQPIPVKIAGMEGLYQPVVDGVGLTRVEHGFVLEGGSVFLCVASGDKLGLLEHAKLKWMFKGSFCGAKQAWHLNQTLCAIHGAFEIEKPQCRFTRLDQYVDVLGMEASVLVDLEDRGGVVCRAAAKDPHKMHEAWTGIDFGVRSGDVFLRCYDKRAELRKVGNEDKAKRYWQQNPEFHGLSKGPITRMESRLKREGCRRFGMDDAMLLPLQQRRFWDEFASHWIRLTEPGSATRKENQTELQWWSEIREGCMAACTRDVEEGPEIFRPQISALQEQLQGCGIIASLMAYPEHQTAEEVVKVLLQMIHENPEGYAAKTEAKRIKLWGKRNAA